MIGVIDNKGLHVFRNASEEYVTMLNHLRERGTAMRLNDSRSVSYINEKM